MDTAKQEGAPQPLSDAQQSAALDRRVAVEVMGWKITGDGIWRPDGSLWLPDPGVRWIPEYSTSIADAWTVVERMANWPLGYAPGFSCEITVLPLAASSDVRVKCLFRPAIWMMDTTPEQSESEDVSKWMALSELPLAICLAALAAIEQESKT